MRKHEGAQVLIYQVHVVVVVVPTACGLPRFVFEVLYCGDFKLPSAGARLTEGAGCGNVRDGDAVCLFLYCLLLFFGFVSSCLPQDK